MTAAPSAAAPPTIYFGFGSNISQSQVLSRCPTSTYLGVARLPGYRWFITASGGANVIEGTPSDEVWGAAYALQPTDEAKMDVLERVPTHFVRELLPAELWEGSPAVVTGPARKVDMLVYISHERTIEGKPRDEYVVRMNNSIRDGLREGIPEAYVTNVLRKYIPAVAVSDSS